MMETTILSTWHIIDGKWVHIAQILKDNYIYFYTDGQLERKEEASKLGGVQGNYAYES